MTPDQHHRHPRIAAQAMDESVPAAGLPSPPPSITCPQCDRTSWNPHDVAEGYCGYCHDWLAAHDAEVAARTLRAFADAHRFPREWVMFRRPDGSGVTIGDLLRETANRIGGGGGE